MITGWKSINEYTGYSRNTIVLLIKNEKFPVIYISGKPTTTAQAIQKWFENRIEQTLKPAK